MRPRYLTLPIALVCAIAPIATAQSPTTAPPPVAQSPAVQTTAPAALTLQEAIAMAQQQGPLAQGHRSFSPPSPQTAVRVGPVCVEG